MTPTTEPPASPLVTPAGQVVATFGVVAIVIPAGSVSDNASPVRFDADPPVLAIEIVNVDVPLAAIVVGENDLLSDTSVALLTVSVAVAGEVLVIPSVVDSALAGIVFR